MKTAFYRRVVTRSVLSALGGILFLNLLAFAEEESLPFDPLDKEGRLEALMRSEKWAKASPEERRKMEIEIYEDWADYGGLLPPEVRQDMITYDPRKGFGRVEGRVVDEFGKPLAGVVVTFRGYELGPGSGSIARRPPPAITATDGRFVAEKVYGHWNVIELRVPYEFTFPHYRMDGHVLPGSETPDRKAAPAYDMGTSFTYFPALQVLVEKEKTTDVGDIVCTLPLTVRGKVTLEGKPMSGVCIMRLGRGLFENRNRDLVCRTDERGYFEYYVFPPYNDGLVIGVFEPKGIFKSSACFLTAKSIDLKYPVPGRTVEVNFALQEFAELEIEIDCPDTRWYGLDSIGRFCYFFDKAASGSEPLLSAYWLEESTNKRRFRVQPGTYDVCLAGTNCTPWLWLRNVTFAPGEKRREKFVVKPEDYAIIEGTVKFRYGEKEFTIMEVANILKGTHGTPTRSPLLAEFDLFVKCRLALFQALPGFDPAQVLPQALPNAETGRVILIAPKVPQSTIEFWAVPVPTAAAYIVRDPGRSRVTFWTNAQGDWAHDPGIATSARTVKLWTCPLVEDDLPKNLDIKVDLLAVIDAALQRAIKAETPESGYYDAEALDYDDNYTLMDRHVAAKTTLCAAFRDFLLSHKSAANLSLEDTRRLDKLLTDLAKYEKLLPFRTARPQ